MESQTTSAARIERAQKLMAETGIDLLVVGPSSDFFYLTGHAPHLSERLTAIVLPRRGQPSIVAPQFEAPLLSDLAGRFDLILWTETQNPTARIVELARAAGASTVAVNDELWSTFLLQIQERLPSASYRRGDAVLARLRLIKDAGELELLREASRRTDDAWAEFCATTQLTGQTERQVADRIHALMAAREMPELPFCIVASGPNGASPHHVTGDRVIQPGDPVVIDFGGIYQGYYSDITRTPIAGEPSDEVRRVYDVVLQANQAAFEAIRPSVPCQEVDQMARAVITRAGYGEAFTHRLGHGIGLTGHEAPFLVEGNQLLLAPGMVVSDEPGIYLTGRFGVRIEDLVVVTENGGERLNHASRALTSLP